MAREWGVRPGTGDFADACGSVEPGDTIRLLAGNHVDPVVLRRSGTRDNPIHIVADEGVVIDGGQVGHPDILPDLPNGSLKYPDWTSWAFLKLDGVSWVRIEGLRAIKNCWPCFLFGRRVEHIAVRRCVVEGGTYPLFFRDPFITLRRSRDLLVEDCDWQQDTSKSHVNWTTSDWRHLHGELGRDGVMRKELRHFAGGFFGSCDIRGEVTLRGNRISDSYNGFCFGVSRELRRLGYEAIRQCNRDVEIANNVFTRVRDNPVEPETYAHNWVVRHNTMFDCHTWFSMDGVAGGHWYIYGNLGWFRTRQGGPENHMGKVLKFSSSDGEAVPDKPIYFFNNSWFLRCPVTKGDPKVGDYRIRHLTFRNNAIQYCSPQELAIPDQPPPICQAGVSYMAFVRWSDDLGSIDHTICDHPDFPATLRAHGHEVHGVASTRPIFVDATNGDLRLAAGSDALGVAAPVHLRRPDGPDIPVRPVDHGAWQGGALISVPALESSPMAAV